MRICYLADGGSIHTARWCRHFAALGHEVHLITFRPAEIEGTTVHYVDAGALSTAGGNWRVLLKRGAVKKLLKKIQPDILHAQYATSYGTVGAMTGFHPYIITALGTDVLISPQQSKVYKFLLRYALGKADWVTAMADHMREAIIRNLGTDPAKVETVMFGIDPAIFNDQSRKLPEGKFVITSTRNFEPVYNLQLLTDALKIVASKIPGLEVNLLGDGSQRAQVEAWVREAGIEAITSFHGRVPQPQIARVLNGSHLFISTSLSDGNNVSLNEAMACGCVSLATDIPANRQWISEGVNGFLVPTDDPKVLADKILYVYGNYPALSASAGNYNGRIIPERALWSVNMAIVEKKYSALTGKK